MTDLGNFTTDQYHWNDFWGLRTTTANFNPLRQRYLIGYTTSHHVETIIPANSDYDALQILEARLGCKVDIRYAFPIGD